MNRTGTLFFPARPASSTSNGPTAKAIRYLGSGFVSANRTVFHPSAPAFSSSTGVFETAMSEACTRSVSCHGTLNPGSSKQGNARRANMLSNCVNR